METFNREAGSFEPHHFRTQRDRDIRVSLNLMSTPDVGRVGGEEGGGGDARHLSSAGRNRRFAIG